MNICRLWTEPKPSIRADHAPRAPPAIRRAEHAHDASNLIIIRRPPARPLLIPHKGLIIDPLAHLLQRRTLHERLHLPLKLRRRPAIHVRRHRPRVHCVDGAPLGQLAAPGARHRLERGLGAAVDGLVAEAQGGGHGGEVDDAAGAVGREVGERGLHEQEGAEDVGSVLGVEGVGGAGFEGQVLADAGVVDDDVDLELAGFGVGEVVFGGGDDVGAAGGGAEGGLHGDGFDGVAFFELFGESGGEGCRGGGGVVED